jgi:hypothetical protein
LGDVHNWDRLPRGVGEGLEEALVEDLAVADGVDQVLGLVDKLHIVL